MFFFYIFYRIKIYIIFFLYIIFYNSIIFIDMIYKRKVLIGNIDKIKYTWVEVTRLNKNYIEYVF